MQTLMLLVYFNEGYIENLTVEIEDYWSYKFIVCSIQLDYKIATLFRLTKDMCKRLWCMSECVPLNNFSVGIEEQSSYLPYKH